MQQKVGREESNVSLSTLSTLAIKQETSGQECLVDNKETVVKTEQQNGSNVSGKATHSLSVNRKKNDPVSHNELPAKKVKTENCMTDENVNGFDGPFIKSQGIIKREYESRPSSENSESDSEFQASFESSDPAKESSEEDEAVRGNGVLSEEEQNRQINYLLAKKVKAENLVAEEVDGFDKPDGSSRRRIKRERNLDGQTEDDQPDKEPKASKLTPIQTETTAFDCYDFNDLIRSNQSRMKAESGQKDKQSGEKDEEGDQEEKRNGGEEVEGGEAVLNEEQVATVKQEPVNLVQNEATAFDCYDFNDLVRKNQSRMKEEAKSHDHLSSASVNLKVVYDVEYRAPD